MLINMACSTDSDNGSGVTDAATSHTTQRPIRRQVLSGSHTRNPARARKRLGAKGMRTLCWAALALCAAQAPATVEVATTESFYAQRLGELVAKTQALQAESLSVSEGADLRDLERRFQALVRDYRSLIADNPEGVEARLFLAQCLTHFGDRGSAYAEYIQVLGIDPTVATAHHQVGVHLAEAGHALEALAYFLRAAELAPEEALYASEIGRLLSYFRDELIATDAFDAAQIDAQLLEAFREAARLAPEHFDAQMRYGEAFYDVAQPDWSVALEHWDRVAAWPDLRPRQREAIALHRAHCLFALGQRDAAQTQLDAIKNSFWNPSKQQFPAGPADADAVPLP